MFRANGWPPRCAPIIRSPGGVPGARQVTAGARNSQVTGGPLEEELP